MSVLTQKVLEDSYKQYREARDSESINQRYYMLGFMAVILYESKIMDWDNDPFENSRMTEEDKVLLAVESTISVEDPLVLNSC